MHAFARDQGESHRPALKHGGVGSADAMARDRSLIEDKYGLVRGAHACPGSVITGQRICHVSSHAYLYAAPRPFLPTRSLLSLLPFPFSSVVVASHAASAARLVSRARAFTGVCGDFPRQLAREDDRRERFQSCFEGQRTSTSTTKSTVRATLTCYW